MWRAEVNGSEVDLGDRGGVGPAVDPPGQLNEPAALVGTSDIDDTLAALDGPIRDYETISRSDLPTESSAAASSRARDVPVSPAERRPRPDQVDHQVEVSEQLTLVAFGSLGLLTPTGTRRPAQPGEPRLLISDREHVPTIGPSNAREQSLLARLLLTPEEAAKLLAVGRTTLYGLLQSGELSSVRIGACRRIPYDAVRAFVDGLRAHPNDNVTDHSQ